jgi:hypothetical protein
MGAAMGASGPATSRREEQNSANTSIGTMAAYRPTIGGSPAICA